MPCIEIRASSEEEIMLTIRIRHAGGTLRIENALPSWTFTQLKSAIREKLHLENSVSILLYNSPPSAQGAVEFVDDTLTLQECGLQHGAMLFVDHTVLPSTITTAQAPSTSKTIDVHGNLVASGKSHTGSEFRPGLLSLRDQKLHWTLTEMTELDDNYTFVIKGKEPNYCSQVSLDFDSAQDFQRFCSVDNRFQKLRCSLLFGRFVDNDTVTTTEQEQRKRASQYGQTKGKMRVSDLKTDDEEHDLARQRVEVEFFFDPEMSHEYRINFEAESLKDCLSLASALGMQWVGIIFSHAKRTNTFDSREILLCGEACLEATGGKVDSPFVICKVCPDEQGLVQMDAFQLTKTCLEMQREEALLAMEGGGGVSSAFCAVDEKFTVMIEAKPSEVVDCDYFIKRVPIQSHKSSFFTLKFPREHRGDPKWSGKTLKQMVDKLGPRAAEWRKMLRDFHLLFFLTKPLGVETVQEICHEIALKDDEGGNFPEGFALMVREACNS